LKWFVSVAATVVAAASLRAQTQVVVGDVGPGISGRILRETLAQPHAVIEPDSGWYVIRRGEEVPVTLIVLGRTAAVAGTVHGDVLVVGGDLFIRPGGHVTGNATAIGGGVYPSSLGFVEGAMRSFRENTFAIASTSEGYRLDYQSLRERPSPPLLLPGVYGLRAPAYDRVNGMSVAFGPAFSIDSGLAEANVVATYRSDLGKIDPSLELTSELSRRIRFRARAERGTFTNDSWIWSDLVNSVSVFVSGADTRNYYRADRGFITAHQTWEFDRVAIEPYIGALTERAWSVGPAFLEQRGPWSIFERTDSLGMWRPNPAVEDGRISSALTGATATWQAQNVSVKAETHAELNFAAPNDERFEQLTSDATVGFPTFGEQSYALEVHWVTTFGDTPPPQRFAYLGGPGTLPFIDLLSEGGDELLLVEQRYSIPIPQVRLGMLGAPTLLLRHRLGSAGVGSLPSFDQVLGVGVLVALVRGELQIDPSRHKARLSFGFSFSR
jgi:hypothetical protein